MSRELDFLRDNILVNDSVLQNAHDLGVCPDLGPDSLLGRAGLIRRIGKKGHFLLVDLYLPRQGLKFPIVYQKCERALTRRQSIP